jgi:hypothetical protein
MCIFLPSFSYNPFHVFKTIVAIYKFSTNTIHQQVGVCPITIWSNLKSYMHVYYLRAIIIFITLKATTIETN